MCISGLSPMRKAVPWEPPPRGGAVTKPPAKRTAGGHVKEAAFYRKEGWNAQVLRCPETERQAGHLGIATASRLSALCSVQEETGSVAVLTAGGDMGMRLGR